MIAQIVKIQTLVDGGIRVTLDYPETAIGLAAQLMEMKRNGELVEIIPAKQASHLWPVRQKAKSNGAL